MQIIRRREKEEFKISTALLIQYECRNIIRRNFIWRQKICRKWYIIFARKRKTCKIDQVFVIYLLFS